jgi:hypothetical protein
LNGAYARLKNVQIGYTLTKDQIKRLPFSRVRFYASGEDLFTLSKMGVFKGVVDPEMKTIKEGSTTEIASPYPFARTVSFGINLDF